MRFYHEWITFSEFVEQSKKNEKNCKALLLQINQLDNLSNDDVELFLKEIEENNTMTKFDISGNNILFIDDFINSLEKNFTITTLQIDSKGLSDESILRIHKVLQRNRNRALTCDINPKLISVSSFNLNKKCHVSCDPASGEAFSAVESGNIDLEKGMPIDYNFTGISASLLKESAMLLLHN